MAVLVAFILLMLSLDVEAKKIWYGTYFLCSIELSLQNYHSAHIFALIFVRIFYMTFAVNVVFRIGFFRRLAYRVGILHMRVSVLLLRFADVFLDVSDSRFYCTSQHEAFVAPNFPQK